MKEEIEKAIEVLKGGGLILYPTDTVWGIGCDATNDAAVEKVYALKKSVNKKSMLVLVRDLDHVSKYADKIPGVAWELLEVADTPLTLILPNGRGVSEKLIPEERTLGIRVPKHAFCEELLKKFNRPIVSTSANISGAPAPARFEEIGEEIRKGVDYIVPKRYEGSPTFAPSSIIAIDETAAIKIIR